jgi:site-specific recombinase XerD
MEGVEEDKILTKNEELLAKYLKFRGVTQGMSDETLASDRSDVGLFMQWIETNCEKTCILDITESDLTDWLQWLMRATYTPKSKKGQPKREPKPYSEMTKFQKHKCIKVFLRWLHKKNPQVPDLTTEIALKKPKTEKEIQVLTIQDVEQIITGCLNPRDIAMIAFLFDAGVRRGELLKITYSNVKFVGGGVEVMVPPIKYGDKSRRVFCVWCASRMKIWYDCHPTKKAADYFFCSIVPPYGKQSKQGQWEVLQKIKRRSGYQGDFYNHQLRHSSATLYSAIDEMNNFKLNKRFGWSPASRVGNRYIHLTGRESDDDIRRAFGQPIPKKTSSNEYVVQCPQCNTSSPMGVDYCHQCRHPLSDKAIREQAEYDAEQERVKTEKIKQEIKDEMMHDFLKSMQGQGQKRKKNTSLDLSGHIRQINIDDDFLRGK